MATTLLSQWAATMGPVVFDPGPAQEAADFRHRVSMAATAAAIAISNEATATPNHANRVTLAKQVGDSPASWEYPFALALASQSLDNAATDAAINTGVATVWNTLAGVV